ncbi:YdcF family protein [Rhodococcus sp. NPDC058521]|uniref:YdcF family protein n=1 Tax=Rhodococcus sp. NPDC058521 TaxID=3346536 RepID=UPI003665C7F5
MVPTKKRLSGWGVLTASFVTAGVAVTSAPAAQADITPTTIINGVLSTVGGCQTNIRDIIVRCTAAETLTPQSPIMLDLNPLGTNIVVLGAGLNRDGSMPPVLHERLQVALKLARQYPFTPIITSGGVPQSGITEARAMRDWLVANGVWAGRITEEGTSRSTIENARNTNGILASRGATGAVVVSSSNHVERAMNDFRVAVAGRIPVAGVIAA